MKKCVILFIVVIVAGVGIKAQTISGVKIDTTELSYTINPIDSFPYETNSGIWQDGKRYMLKQLKLIQNTIPENFRKQFFQKKAYVTIFFNAEGQIFWCFFGVLNRTPVNLSPQEWIELARLFMQIKLDMTQLETEKDFTWGAITLLIPKLLEKW